MYEYTLRWIGAARSLVWLALSDFLSAGLTSVANFCKTD